MKSQWALWLLVAVTTGAISASPASHSWRDFKDITNSGFAEANGERAIQLSVDVPAGSHEVFEAFSSREGLSRWVPMGRVEFRVGGYIEVSGNANAKPGDPNNVRNEILAYVPDRVLVLRNVQSPSGLANVDLYQRTVTVIEFQSLSSALTRVTLTNTGYGRGEAYDKLFKHFEWGNAFTLSGLRENFEKDPVK